ASSRLATRSRRGRRRAPGPAPGPAALRRRRPAGSPPRGRLPPPPSGRSRAVRVGAAQGDFQLALLREALDGDGNPLEGPEPSGEDLVQRMRLVDLDFVDLEEHVPLLDARLGGRAARRDAGDEAACRETAQRGLLRGQALTLDSEVWQDELTVSDDLLDLCLDVRRVDSEGEGRPI